MRRAVCDGAVGDPLISFSPKTYNWGKSRPDADRRRATFPVLAPWVGIQVFDWLHGSSEACSSRSWVAKGRRVAQRLNAGRGQPDQR